MAIRNCPNCLRELSTDLRIDVNGSGFRKVVLGFQCEACGTLVLPEFNPEVAANQTAILGRMPA